MSDTPRPPSDPVRHTQAVSERLQALIDHLREHVTTVDDDQAKALFETAAETLGGLKQAFDDYEAGDEAAWQG